MASKGSCAGPGRPNLKSEAPKDVKDQGRRGVRCPTQGYNRSGRGLTAK